MSGDPIAGRVAPGFEPVRDAFAANFHAGRELGASFAVVRDGEVVVDLWGGWCDRARTRPWRADTLANVWSTTKGLAALCVALLVDRGVLDYEAPVAKSWPEFAAAGKGALTVAELMSHQAGLSGAAVPVTLRDLADHAKMAALLAAQTPFFPAGESGYHALTHGVLAGELVRRASGRTLGRFFAEEIAQPLGADAWIGLPETEDGRAAEMEPPADAPSLPPPQHPAAHAAFLNPPPDPEAPNQRWWRAAEIPAANGQANARALATVYGALVGTGAQGGVRVLAPATLEAATRVRVARPDHVLLLPMRWAAGFLRNLGGLYGPSDAAFGHSGWGGSFGCADPEARLGIGYAMNRMDPNLVGDPRSLALIEAVYASL